MREILQIRPAAVDDKSAITDLIDEAAGWLGTKGLDQWATPWPNKEARDDRIHRGIRLGRTWMAEDNGELVGTITYGPSGNRKLWTAQERRAGAVYVSRLIVRRDCEHRGIGSAMIDWAGQRGIDEWKATLIRVDVWTSNSALHDYYVGQGFERLRICDFKDPWEYPSAALFQKPTSKVDAVAATCFKEMS